jgi:hypothetical protein
MHGGGYAQVDRPEDRHLDRIVRMTGREPNECWHDGNKKIEPTSD